MHLTACQSSTSQSPVGLKVFVWARKKCLIRKVFLIFISDKKQGEFSYRNSCYVTNHVGVLYCLLLGDVFVVMPVIINNKWRATQRAQERARHIYR